MRVSRIAIDACLPETIVSFCDWLVHDSGWKVRDPEAPGSCCRCPRATFACCFADSLITAETLLAIMFAGLEAREIPHLLVGSKSFHSREEVETLRAALTAIEWPEDELSVFATLKGSLFAIPDNLLLRFHHEVGRLHPFRVPADLAPDFQPISGALRLLADLHRGRNRRPIADTVNSLLEATRAHAGLHCARPDIKCSRMSIALPISPEASNYPVEFRFADLSKNSMRNRRKPSPRKRLCLKKGLKEFAS